MDYSPVGAAFVLGAPVEGLTGGGARAAAVDAVFGDLGALPYQHCFRAGTPVLMADGTTKPIEEIQPGDKVRCASETDPEGTAETRAVVEVYHNAPAALLALSIGDGVLYTTFNHPFYIRDKGFVTAAELAVGDEFRTQTGTWASLTSKADPGIVEPVYNLQVNDGHTYFVCTGDGKTSVLVHNDSAPDGQGGFWSSVWMCTKAAATRTDQFAGQVVTAACTGQWVDADTTSGLGYGGAYYGGLGRGGKNIVVGLGNTGKEIGLMGADLANATLDVTTGYQMYRGNLSQTADALQSGELGYGQYYGEFTANTLSAGTYGQGKALYQVSTGQITVDQASQQIGSTGVIQLAGAGLMQAQGIGTTPIRLPNIFGRGGNAPSEIGAAEDAATNALRQTPDQQALTELAKEAKQIGRTNPISQADAQTPREWADEVGLPSRGPEIHPNRPMNTPHIHIGPVDHIRVQ